MVARARRRRVGPFPCRARSGQGTVELVLYISVIVVALAAAAWAIYPDFARGMVEMSRDAQTVMQKGIYTNTSNDRR